MWQGSLDTGLSPAGHRQLDLLANRLGKHRLGYVVASDLGRTMQTASAITDNVVANSAWREFDVGTWEGLTTQQILATHPGQMEDFLAGEDIAPGGGELMSDFGRRVVGAFDSLVTDMSDGDEAHVVTHGGAIWTLISHILGRSGIATSMIPSSNTGLTVVTVRERENPQLTMFNDATHLDEASVQFIPDGRTVTVFRHGQTVGNVDARWQGHSDSPLTPQGQQQAVSASLNTPSIGALHTSPLGRARDTAEIIGNAVGLEPADHDGLKEMAFGSWENLTATEAAASEPDLFAKVFTQGIDLPRGGDGETFTSAGQRVADTFLELVDEAETDLGAVSHGAVIRSYVLNVLGMPFAERNRLPIPRNTSMTSVLYADRRPLLASYNVAPHMEM
jgi:broad specificity phosphatase PhoE